MLCAGLGSNAVEFGQYFNEAMKSMKAGELSPEFAKHISNLGLHIINADNADDFKEIYQQHMVDEGAIGVHKALASSHAIQGLLRSCPQIDPKDPNTFFKQRQCVWGKAIGRVVDHDRTASNPGYRESVGGIALGAQRRVGEGLFVETAVQYENQTIDGDNFEQDGYQVSAGLALKKEIGNLELSSSVAGGAYGIDHRRRYSNLGG